MHDGFGDEVPLCLVDDLHVGVHQVADGLHLTLQLRVHGGVVVLGLSRHKTTGSNTSLSFWVSQLQIWVSMFVRYFAYTTFFFIFQLFFSKNLGAGWGEGGGGIHLLGEILTVFIG